MNFETFVESVKQYTPYIVGGIPLIFKNTFFKILAFLLFFSFMFIFSNYFSKEAQNKQFFTDFLKYVDEQSILKQVIDNGFWAFQNDNIKASEFFEQIISASIDISKQYGKENVKIYQFVINEKPSNPYQLNGNIENDKLIFDNISTKDLTQKQAREFSMVRRKELLDADIDLTAISIYAKNGVAQKTFENNIKKYKGKLFGKKVLIKTISGINANRRGQVFIILYKKTGHFMIFREIGGAQAHNVANLNHQKSLTFKSMKKMKNKKSIAKYDYGLYNMMQDFNLFFNDNGIQS